MKTSQIVIYMVIILNVGFGVGFLLGSNKASKIIKEQTILYGIIETQDGLLNDYEKMIDEYSVKLNIILEAK